MGFQVVVTFIDSFMDDVAYVKDVGEDYDLLRTRVHFCGSENFGLGSLHDDYVRLAGATPHFYSLAPYRFDYRFVDE